MISFINHDDPDYTSDEGHDDQLMTHYVGNASTGVGVDSLMSGLERHIVQNFSGLENAALTRQRHVDCVRRALASTDAAIDNLAVAPELASEDIRQGLQAIEELSGRADMDEVFDRIFSSFCIGK